MLINKNLGVVHKEVLTFDQEPSLKDCTDVFLISASIFFFVRPNISFLLIFPFQCKIYPFLTSLEHLVTGIRSNAYHSCHLFYFNSFCLA